MNGLPFFDYLSSYSSDIILGTEQHFEFAGLVIIGAIVVGMLLAVACYQSGLRGNFAISTAAIFFTLPAVALFGLLVSLFGASLFASVYPVVVLYALLPILRNGIVGLQSADENVIDAARGMGVGSFRMLWQIRFPIAWPLILAGIRVSAQLAVGISAIGAFVVEFGLGTFGFSALDNLGSVNTRNEAIVCIVFVALVALIFDVFFLIVRFFTTPRGIRA